MADDLSPWFEAVPSTAGFHMVVMCKVPMDIPLVIELAKKVEVGLYAIDSFFYQEAPKAGLFLGFGAIETLDIDTALDRLRDILQQVA
jgi:GntR family transcriptional regulator/MocR family aminotransferase